MIQKIDKKAVQDAVQMAYDRCKNETGGKNADYIPYLADVPSNLFGIAACLPDGDMVAVGDSDGKWKAIVSFIAGLAGSDVEVIDELYKSETATNFNNKSIAWLLKNYNRIYDDPDMALDIYTRQCSIGVTARQLATMAATIANSGVNPVTRKAVFKPELTPKIASMMATVGFYEHTGDWLFTTGLPAKTLSLIHI